MNTADRSLDPTFDPVDPRQRRQARVLGLIIGGGFLALVVTCIIIFKANGLPKDPKEWKRLQEQRSALGTESAAPQKDLTR